VPFQGVFVYVRTIVCKNLANHVKSYEEAQSNKKTYQDNERNICRLHTRNPGAVDVKVKLIDINSNTCKHDGVCARHLDRQADWLTQI
jgi:hypothetical protein